MTFLAVLLGLMMPMAAQQQQGGVDVGHDQTLREPRTDSVENNSVNRALARQPGETAEFARVPGDAATPRREWKTGDERGKPPEGRRKKHKRHGHKKHEAPRRTP
jgi:hypothetical protein